MKLLVLAAGYATRLHPLTLTRPKPLLPVAGKAMINHVLDALSPIHAIDQTFVVTNAKFADTFQEWANQQPSPPTIINDGTTDDSNKLGAIGDMHHVVQTEKIDDDLIVVAGDNLFSQPLPEFGTFCLRKNAPVLGVYDVGNLDEVKKYNAITINDQSQITFFEEKPVHPKTTLTGIALYFYPRHVLPLLRQYVKEGNNQDQPGRLIQWLYPKQPVYTWPVPGLWYDIGSKEALKEADAQISNLKS